MIDWTDLNNSITQHFTVKDCLYLHAWTRLATEVDGANFNLLYTLCEKLEQIRAVLNCPMNVHCMFRSIEYNQSQGIYPNADVHSMSLACDFDCSPYLTIDEIKTKLEPFLEAMNIRMEQGTDTWVHIDLHSVGPSGRYFTV